MQLLFPRAFPALPSLSFSMSTPPINLHFHEPKVVTELGSDRQLGRRIFIKPLAFGAMPNHTLPWSCV
jgi:hypothetical protein